MSPSNSTRWSPTPEQLMILEEMYKGGIKTPSASQIQKITAHLSFYGKIEGKNVFYWFQNHKARDRQKLRRKLSKQQQLLQEQLLLHDQCQCPLQNYKGFNVLNPIDPLPPPPLPVLRRLSHGSPAEYLGQLGGSSEGTTARLTNYTWKTDYDPSNMQESENYKIRSRGDDDWMMMTTSMTRDVGPTLPSPCCSNRPLKTLELFPMKAPSLKKDQHLTIHDAATTTSELDNISCFENS